MGLCGKVWLIEVVITCYCFPVEYSSYTLTHLYFTLTLTNGAIGESRKSTPSPLACSQKMIHQTPADPSAHASALSAVRLNPNPSSTHTSILPLLLHFFIKGTAWPQEPSNPSTGNLSRCSYICHMTQFFFSVFNSKRPRKKKNYSQKNKTEQTNKKQLISLPCIYTNIHIRVATIHKINGSVQYFR